MSDAKPVRISLDEATDYCIRVLCDHSTSPANAEPVARALVAAEADGLAGHGLSRLESYVGQAATGKVDGFAVPVVDDRAPAVIAIDAANGFAYPAIDIAAQTLPTRARIFGMAAATIFRSHHCGAAGLTVERLAKAGFAALMFANTPEAIAPAGGTRPVFGTNPIAFAAPAGEKRPFVLDMATTTVANGKIRVAHRLGLPLPEGWAVTAEDGTPVLEAPEKAADWWTLEPLGGTLPLGGHKGYGLGVMVDILAGLLSGGGFSRELPTGHNQAWFMAIDIGRFRPIDEFKAHMDAMIRELHSTPPAPGSERVLVAGDPEAETYERRSREGIPLQRKLVEEVRAKAEELGAPISI